MLFNSLAYALFLPLVFILYWIFSGSRRAQNILLLITSYIFYGWWDYKFLVLIALSTAVDFFVGKVLLKQKENYKRKILLGTSLIFNLGILAIFKYFNFFIESWILAWGNLGVEMNVFSLNVILPVGISFYTFQTLSYTIDVYKKRIEPTRNFLDFAVYVAFFPQLVAGPIERAKHLLPQFSVKRIFKPDWAKSGIHLIIWGFFKKLVIADNCAVYVNAIFDNYEQMDSLTLLLGAVLFAFQIYGDFSGYSDIAIGTARLFGFDLMQNFNYPYFSRNIGEFWRRWHISLSTWFRDYLYIPLGGSRGDMKQKIRNIFIIFLVSGLWHGANWTFVIWGGLHALFFLPILLQGSNRKFVGELPNFASFKDIIRIILTFFLVTFAWIFFRAPNISTALFYLERLFFNFSFNLGTLPSGFAFQELLLLLLIFIGLEWIHKKEEHPFTGILIPIKLILTLLVIILFGHFSGAQEFIYFQF